MLALLLTLALQNFAAVAQDATGAPAPSGRLELASAERLRRMLGAEPAAPLRLDEVLGSVDRRHPRLLAALLGLDRARGGLMSARGAFDPNFGFGARSLVLGYYGYTFADVALRWDSGPARVYGGWRGGVDAWDRAGIPVYYEDRWTQDRGELRVGLEVPLLEGLVTDRNRTALRIALAEQERAGAAADSVDVALREAATGAWALWVAAGRDLALEEALYEIAETRQRAVAARVRLGDLAELEDLRAAQFLARRLAALERARGAFAAAVEALALYLRDGAGDPVRVGLGRLPVRRPPPSALDRDVEALVALGIERHPDVRALRAVIAQREAAVRLERNRQLPRLDAFGEVSQDLASAPERRIDKLEATNLLVGVRGGVPTANRAARGATIAATAQLEAAEADLQWLTERVEAVVRQAIARERAALEGLRAATRAVELGLRLQEAEQRRFDLGEIDLLRMWQIEQETADAVRAEIRAWNSYEVARAALVAAVGGALP